jgi:hypothetical protein
MKDTTAAGKLFKPAPNKLETKAQVTDSAARAIIDAEATKREAKTARLREARREKEEAERLAEPEAPVKKKRVVKKKA